jgi:hypothetical protein
MTRRGKIARLPLSIREQVNRRLDNGVEGKQIVQWLNSLPDVAAVMAAEFDGQAVNEPNLSHWKTGGYQDWREEQEAQNLTRQFVADAAQIARESGGEPAEKLAVCLTARIAVALRQMPSAKEDPQGRLEWLRRLCADLSKLRKGNRDAQWLQLKRDKHALNVKKFNAGTAAIKPAEKPLTAGDEPHIPGRPDRDQDLYPL